MTEADIQRDIIDAARSYGYKVYRLNAGSVRHNVKMAEDGTPDLLIAASGGVSIWAEVKRPDKDPTDIQLQRHRELEALGHRVVVLRSVDDLTEILPHK
jgi:hypothetical protein